LDFRRVEEGEGCVVIKNPFLYERRWEKHFQELKYWILEGGGGGRSREREVCVVSGRFLPFEIDQNVDKVIVSGK
jgi:hypothetical protein